MSIYEMIISRRTIRKFKQEKIDPKILLPKPNKDNYNMTNSYRPITLESVIGKLLERVIDFRLR